MTFGENWSDGERELQHYLVKDSGVGDTEWMKDGKCSALSKEEGSYDTFFPDMERGSAPGQYERAKSICRECEVRLDCVEFIVNNPSRFGVWGGYIPSDRKLLSKQISREQEKYPHLSRGKIARLIASTETP